MITIRRALLAATPLAATLLAPAARATPGSPALRAWVGGWTTTGATVCAEGRVHEGTGGVWRLTVAGARSDGTWIAPPVIVRTGPAFALTCFGVAIAGAANGSFTGTLTYTIAGAAERSDPAAGLADLAGLAGFAAGWTAATPPTDASYTTGT